MTCDVAAAVPTCVGPRVPHDSHMETLACSTSASYLLAVKDDAVNKVRHGTDSTRSSTIDEIEPDQLMPHRCHVEFDEDVGDDDRKGDGENDSGQEEECPCTDDKRPRCNAAAPMSLPAPLLPGLSSPTEDSKESACKDIIKPLANVLDTLAALGCRPQRITSFHAVRPPKLPIYDYLLRISGYFGCSEGSLVVALVYIDRVMKINPHFVVSILNIHRLLVTAVVVAAKFHEDTFYSNKHYARVGGVRVEELNALEAQLLELLGWRLHVLPEEYQQYRSYILMAQHSGAFHSMSGVAPGASPACPSLHVAEVN